MDVSLDRLCRYVKRHPQLSKMKRGSGRFPRLRRIKVGESFLVPKVERGKYNYTRYYMLVRRLGFRVSVTTAKETQMRITRVA